MFISGIGVAVPPRQYRQEDCWAAMESCPLLARLQPRSRAILRKVLLGNNGIATRSLALESLEEAFEIKPDILHRRFALHAPLLATEAARRAMQEAGVAAAEIDAILISTCTGYLCPGLTSYVGESLGLHQNVMALDLVGQGCGAALPNLRTASNLLGNGSTRRVLSICVEICSAAFYLDNDPGVLISACLFGDGAGAMLLTSDPLPQKRRVEWKHAESLTLPSYRDLLRFEHRNGMLRNILAPEVPALAAEAARIVFQQSAKRMGVRQDEITSWIWHAGGRDVLQALRKEFGLTEQDTAWSSDVLRELGNISSPFVMHVLQRALAGQSEGGLWWMSAFGAGFSSHGALLNVE